MIKVEGVYIFNRGINENNVRIVNSIDYLMNHLINVPILMNNSVIGVITEVTSVSEDKLYGTVMFYDKKYKDYKYFKNYEVQPDYNFQYNKNGITEIKIANISAIYLTDNLKNKL